MTDSIQSGGSEGCAGSPLSFANLAPGEGAAAAGGRGGGGGGGGGGAQASSG